MMLSISLLAVTFLAVTFTALAAPAERRQLPAVALLQQQPATTPALWYDGWVTDYPIHTSCNSTQTALLRQAFDELKLLSQHAKDHILRYGNSSSYFLKYFGDAATAEPIGWFDKILNNDKTGVLCRCDDVDGNCKANPDWHGHHRGENGTDETVICDLSFTTRWPLAGLCMYGYTVAGGSTASYFASDLLHRLFHTTKIGDGAVGDYVDTYEEVLALAKNDSATAVRNSATFRYFALDVYAYDIAVPGLGCTGVPPPPEQSEEGGGTSSSAGSATSATPGTAPAETGTAVASTSEPESTSESNMTPAASECHMHDSGDVHCE